MLKALPPNDLSFSKLKCPHLLKGGGGREDTIIKVDEKRKLSKSANKAQHRQFHKLSWYI